jgi:hypothetical protein
MPTPLAYSTLAAGDAGATGTAVPAIAACRSRRFLSASRTGRALLIVGGQNRIVPEASVESPWTRFVYSYA